MRLIDADVYDAELKRQIVRLPNGSTEQDRNEIVAIADGLTKARILLLMMPTVDAEPVRHGEWERVEVIYPEENKNAVPGAIASMFCPVCKRWHSEVYFYGNPIERVNYCNHCGARMSAAKDINVSSKKEDGDA